MAKISCSSKAVANSIRTNPERKHFLSAVDLTEMKSADMIQRKFDVERHRNQCAFETVGEVVSIGTASVGLEQVAAMAEDVCVGTEAQVSQQLLK